MARIPNDELERLKREVDLVELVRSSGVELSGKGDRLKGLCPYHEDKEPSLVVTPSKNLWRCFGACDTGGSVIDWVMRRDEVGFRQAVVRLQELRGREPDGRPSGSPAPSTAQLSHAERQARGLDAGPELASAPVAPDADDAELLDQVVSFFTATLKATPRALDYLQERVIDDPGAIEAHRLGFGDRRRSLPLPDRQVKAGKQLRERLRTMGVTYDSGHLRFNGRLVVPLFDAEGRVVQMYGRAIGRLRDRSPDHLYLSAPRRGVWNLDAFRGFQELILCESHIDALTFWCAGLRNVTSSFGTTGFTGEILEAMQAYGVRRVLIAYDRDDAGDTGAGKVAEQLAAAGISAWRVALPRGMDVNEFAQKTEPRARALQVLVGAAQHMAGPAVGPLVGPLATPAAPAAAPAAAAKKEGSGSADPSSLTAAEGAAAAAPAAAGPSQAVAAPVGDVPAEVDEHQVVLRLGDRIWRARGLARNLSYEQLRVNLLVSRESDGEALFHVDTLDLCSARQRGSYVKQAAAELGLKAEAVKRELGKVFLKLELLRDERIKATLEPKEQKIELSEAERAEALDLLRSPDLLGRVAEDLETCGLVGESINKVVAWLAAVSRKLEEPLAVMVQSSSAAGKSALMNAVLSFMPPEERIQYSAMTGQSLYYMGEKDLKHKVLAIAEEEGAERASYALKLLQSEGELSIASTGKDPSSGKLVTHEYHVEGPVAIVLTTTAIDLDEELQNRCLVLGVDESREQTKAIHRQQRRKRTLAGLADRRRRRRLQALHQNAQRLLEPLAVLDPWGEDLTFLNDTTRTRRDNAKYLALIDAIALVHQHQREVKEREVEGERARFVEVRLSDIEIANELAREVLGRTLDELPPQTRRFAEMVLEMVSGQCEREGLEQPEVRFTRRQVLEHTGWSLTQVSVHMRRLVEMEYVLVHRGGRGQSFVYELLWKGEGRRGERFVMGLKDVEKLRQRTNLTASERGVTASEGHLTGSKRGQNGPKTGGCRTGEKPTESGVVEGFPRSEAKTPRLGPSAKPVHRSDGSEPDDVDDQADEATERQAVASGGER